MKAINKTAAKTLHKMVSMLTDGYVKIQNSKAYMAVSMEYIGKNTMGTLYSVAHYGEQMGDLLADPEMVFILGGDGEFYPISIRQDYIGKNQEALQYDESGKIKGWYPRMQAELASFANFWFKNIKSQQGI
ncbi:MAG: hypothetical protein WA705_29675 [Candidatus Ozemobacteraceae bacterium]